MVVQPEFGLFGDLHVDHILRFLDQIQKPCFIVFQTVLPNPDTYQRRVVQCLMDHCEMTIVITNTSASIL